MSFIERVITAFAAVCLMLLAMGVLLYAIFDEDKGSLSNSIICIAGVQYDVSTDLLTGKKYLTVQTNEEFELILCEGN